MRQNRFLLCASAVTLLLAGCVDVQTVDMGGLVPQVVEGQGPPEPDRSPVETDSPASDAPVPLPSPIHDERTVSAAIGPADGTGAECGPARPCFDYPFTLARPALIHAELTRSGNADGLLFEVLLGDERIALAETPLGGPQIRLEQVLDAGDFVLRVHVYRTVAGSYLLDASFHEPPVQVPLVLPAPDPLLDQQWGLPMSRVPEAWAHATGKGVTIAFIDSGVDLDHPEFAGKLVLVEGAALVGGSLDDTDPSGHGTHVAGIAAAAAHNGIGIAGVAPDALIMPVRIFTVTGPEAFVQNDFFTEHSNDIAKAIRLAADNGADVISMSMSAGAVGGDTLFVVAPQVDEALEYAWSKGAVMVGAAGNGYVVPHCADIAAHPRVLCAGSVGPSGQRATYSHLDVWQDFVMAPGGESDLFDCTVEVLSTAPHGEGVCSQEVDGAWYKASAGTSMAAPFVAGVAALLVEQGLTNEQVVQRIKDTANPSIGLEDSLPDPNPVYGHGLVDAYCAVTDDAGEGCQT